MKKKRLFIFAAYDVDGVVDDTLVYYLKLLGENGDVIVVMDNDAKQSEINKLKGLDGVIYAVAKRHAEYDFGSYKRGFKWAKKNKILDKYKYVWMVNDSCYALGNLSELIARTEMQNADVMGVQEKTNPQHIQSFWMCLRKSVFMSEWFNKFMESVTRQPTKHDIVKKYEYGFAEHLLSHGKTMAGIIVGAESVFFERPLDVIRKYNIPLVKKKPWSIGRKHYNRRIIKKILGNAPDDVRAAIIENAIRNNNAFNPKYVDVKYVDVKRIAPFVTIVRKVRHPENRWVMLFGCIQITKLK